MASLQAENVRLRALLNSSALLRDDVLVAELVGVSPDPERLQLVLNKGERDGVFVGQPLIDADGLMGQIVEVSGGTSRALLITDLTHSVPVQINRNGVRAIAEGTGILGSLEIRNVSSNTDIQPGDLLVLYTDGIVEAMNTEQRMYDLDRLCRLIESMPDAPTRDICQQVFSDVAGYSPVLEDDRSLVVLRQTGAPSA